MKKIKLLSITLISAFTLYSCGDSASTDNEVTSSDSSTVTTTPESTTANPNSFGSTEGPQITFEKIEHHFGEVTKGEKVKFPFLFTNTGSDTLFIYRALTTCGCTTSKLPENTPILPGASDTVEVQFNTTHKAPGDHEKEIKLQTNVFENREQPVTIKIKATVVE